MASQKLSTGRPLCGAARTLETDVSAVILNAEQNLKWFPIQASCFSNLFLLEFEAVGRMPSQILSTWRFLCRAAWTQDMHVSAVVSTREQNLKWFPIQASCFSNLFLLEFEAVD